MHRGWLMIVIGLQAGAAFGQTPQSNAVGECTLVVDPTALRLCVESARQTRPASTFDPTATSSSAPGSTAADLLPSYGASARPRVTSGESGSPRRSGERVSSPRTTGVIP